MIYDPREDSYLLQKYIKKYARGNVLDMGTGSGILAQEAQKYAQTVLAVDINPECIEHVRKKGMSAHVSDLFEGIEPQQFDLIMFNPPYLPEEPKEPADSALATTGGKKGHETIERFLRQAKKYLAPTGKILLAFSSLSGNIQERAGKAGYTMKILDAASFDFEKVYVARLEKSR